MTSSFSEDDLTNVEAEIKGTMPEECYNNFKRLALCHYEKVQEVEKTSGKEKVYEMYTTPTGRYEGCMNEYNALHKCYFDFFYRYVNLKNYAAEIEGKSKPFDKKEVERQIKNMNIGINKF